MTDFLNLRAVLDFIYNIVQSHGWSIIIFVILIRAILLPLDVKSRKGMRQMQLMQPEIDKLTKKYADDKEKLQKKQAELFKKNHYNPMAGCWPILIQYPVLICMFGAMHSIANEQLIREALTYISGQQPQLESWLWVKSLWMADSPFTTYAPSLSSLQAVTDLSVWTKVFKAVDPELLQAAVANIPEFAEAFDFTSAETIAASVDAIFSSSDTLQTTISTIYNAMAAQPIYLAASEQSSFMNGVSLLGIINLTMYKEYNGLLILPALAGLTQWISTKLMPQTGSTAQQADGKGGMGNFMKYFFPILSVYFCLVSNAGFAIYWVMGNIIAGIQTVVLNKYFDMKDKKAAISAEGDVH